MNPPHDTDGKTRAEQEASDRPARDRRASSCSWRSTGRSSSSSRRQPRGSASRFPTRPPSSRRCRPATSRRSRRRTPRSRGRSEHAIRYPAARQEREAGDRLLDPRAGLRRHEGARHAAAGEGCRRHGEGAAGTPWWETLLAGFGPTILFFGLWYLDHAALGQRQHVLLRKLEGEEVRADGRAGHVRRRRRDRRGQGGAGRGRRLPPRPGQVPQARRPHPARRAADRRSPAPGKTLLARAVAGEAGVPFFSMSALGVRRDDRRRRRLPRPRPVRAGEGRRLRRSSSSTRSTRSAARAAPARSAAPTTSASRRSTRS